jgi:hypothetical protein
MSVAQVRRIEALSVFARKTGIESAFLAKEAPGMTLAQTVDAIRLTKVTNTVALAGSCKALRSAAVPSRETQTTLRDRMRTTYQEKAPGHVVDPTFLQAKRLVQKEIVDPRAGALHQAAGDNDVEEVRQLLDQGVFVDALYFQSTPLRTAAVHGSLEVVQLLLARGADVDEEALPAAASNGRTRVVHELLLAGANVDLMDFEKKTALMQAVECGSAEVVRQLLAAGASVNLKSGYGVAPLHMASMGYCRPAEIVDLLLAEGANVHALDSRGRTALDLAKERDVIRMLTSKWSLWGRFRAWMAS